MPNEERTEKLWQEVKELREKNHELMSNSIQLCTELERVMKKAEEYRELYLAELQKRLDLAARVREIERLYVVDDM